MNSEEYYDRVNVNRDEDKIIIFRNATFAWARPMKRENMKLNKEKGKSNKNKRKLNIQSSDSLTSEEGGQDAPFTLNDISLEIGREEFIGVTGSIGSGKTSLLLAVIGEMLKKNGDLQLPESLNSNAFYYNNIIQITLSRLGTPK